MRHIIVPYAQNKREEEPLNTNIKDQQAIDDIKVFSELCKAAS